MKMLGRTALKHERLYTTDYISEGWVQWQMKMREFLIGDRPLVKAPAV
jgi:hypothetical protein